MLVSLTRWPNDAVSPLIFMIDDLANIYFRKKFGDWGGRQCDSDGLFSFITNNLLILFPQIKFTFFLVTDVRCRQVVGEYDFAADCNKNGFDSFLSEIVRSGHEIAFHGTTHGKLKNGRFIQEWDSYESFPELMSAIKKGKNQIFNAVGDYPLGGKYCGYSEGQYGHKSIVESSFRWWFDRWDHDVMARPFGEWIDDVFYIPSNIDCSNYSLSMLGQVPTLKYIKSIYRAFTSGSSFSKIKLLLASRGIISLQEHSSPIRTDGVRQFPNIYDDINFIHSILRYLERHNIWYATASMLWAYESFYKNHQIILFDNAIKILANVDLFSVDFPFTISIDLNYCQHFNALSLNGEVFLGHRVQNALLIDLDSRCINNVLDFSLAK